MAWISSHTELARHPKVILLRKAMRWSKFEAIGFLHCFWWTVLEYAPNGVISTLSPEIIADALGLELEVYQRAATAMESVRLLDRVGDVVLVHDWMEYARIYLRDTKFKGSKGKYEDACRMHGLSADVPQTIGGLSAVPTNQPNQPTHPPPQAGGGRGRKWKPQSLEVKP